MQEPNALPASASAGWRKARTRRAYSPPEREVTMRCFRLVAAFLLLTATPTILQNRVLAQLSEDSQTCLACHGAEEMKSTSVDFRNAKVKLPVFVDGKAFEDSVHGSLNCSDCHDQFTIDDHPSRTFSDLRGYSLQQSEKCRDCHSFQGIHERMVQGQSQLACVDCHTAHAVRRVEESEDACLNCHQHELTLKLADANRVSLSVDDHALQESIHRKLRCVDCHFGFSSKEHPERTFQNRRELKVAFSDTCRRCHFDKYTRTLESVHYRILRQGNQEAPVCVDCHGSHAIRSGRHDRLAAARRCEDCHKEVYQTYIKSVHGTALISEDNQDVPICSDCHTAHQISDPTRVDFRNEIPRMCGNCHADPARMNKYGLSTAVLSSYLEDFHGVTLTFYRKENEPVRHIAVCTDCHGIHDIVSLRARNSAAVKSVLMERCRTCHPEATANFPDSWLSHYEPTLARAPLVYAVELFYKLFIPFMIIGLLLQILLHVWRYAINR